MQTILKLLLILGFVCLITTTTTRVENCTDGEMDGEMNDGEMDGEFLCIECMLGYFRDGSGTS